MPTTPSPAAEPTPIAGHLPERIGPFFIHGVLGRGGMGVVFAAVAENGARVALKVIRPYGDPDRSELLVARFLREAKILEQLDHPGIVKLVASGETEGVLFLAMERIEGVSLLTVRRESSLSLQPLSALGAQLASALAHMHEAGVVHRDIKPANILIDRRGQPIITDFGISGLQEATGITRHGDLLGSPGFMAPEVIDGQTPTPLSDQFSLGRLLYELGATGPAKKLRRGAPILEILQAALEVDWRRFPRGDRWSELESILKRMLEHDPEERFPSSRDVEAALRALCLPDVIDSDTLSEQVDKMPVSTSWEALADDLGLDIAEPAPDLRGRPKYNGEEEATQLDLDLVPELMTRRDLAPLLEPSEPPEQPSTTVQELAALLRQISTLQRELDRARAKPPPRRSILPWILLASFALFAGAAAGYLAQPEPETPALVIVPSDVDQLAEPKYRPDEKRGIPSAQDLVDARQMLAAALDHLRARNLDGAERLLGLCIEIADLPDCHKTLGSILALEGDPSSRAHFERYVELAPSAPESAQIRKLLDI